ncbi:MAG: ferritin-like domain-containing protein [archaeon GB-1867-035]|mgnify:CR=1 FL=1|nr:ferritin-like domain-containing protein [Candidatus Culexmicrobium profundum]
MLEEATFDLGNRMIKVLMRSIAHDSRKHAEIFEALVELIRGESAPLTEEEYEKLEGTIKKHIEIESEMIKTITNLLEKLEKKRIAYILKYILDDEKRHHALLKGLQEVISKREVVTEFDWLDMAWKDVPFFF